LSASSDWVNQPLLLQAIAFASQKHRTQRRKDGETPYLNHTIQVALLLAEVAQVTDSEILAAAVLHDTVEDTDASLGEIVAHFGDRVAALVAEVTDDATMPYHQRKQWEIDHAPQLSDDATLIKLADRTANVMDLIEAPAQGWNLKRRQQYLVWAEMVVNACRPVHGALVENFAEVAGRVREQLGMRG
jgi:(p)ppGpp synthase/HD superfamily hydrolase